MRAHDDADPRDPENSDSDWRPKSDSEASEAHEEMEYEYDDQRPAATFVDQPSVVEYLRGLQTHIEHKHSIRATQKVVPGLNPGIIPFDHQMRAARVIENARNTVFKCVLLADPPGLGKTLSSLIPIYRAKNGRGPSVVVAPLSCCRQLLAEVERAFGKTLKAALVVGPGMPAARIFESDVIITSYNHVSAEFAKLNHFSGQVSRYADFKSSKTPVRPHVALLSGILDMDGAKSLGEYLVLDEAHAVKNTDSQTYNAVKLLRSRCNTCVMLTGTPLDNTWQDGYGYLSLLEGHPVVSQDFMLKAFSDWTEGHSKARAQPEAHHVLRLCQLFDAITLRRPESVVHSNLPKMTTKVVTFDLDQDSLVKSNFHYKKYIAAVHAARGNGPQAAWRSSSDIGTSTSPGAPVGLQRWREALSADGAWRSPRVDVILDLVNQARDIRPDDAIIVSDESVYFLDIVGIALDNMYEPLPYFRYDGRMNAAARDSVLKAFREAVGARVLLISRGTCGQGLNLQCANVVIRCSSWWKTSWDKQVDARVYRPGQTKPVFVYEVNANDCMVEMHRSVVRTSKDAYTSAIMDSITRDDDAPLPPARNIV
ncbi:P-loop containing nucleoside triphosphate hydrolase protein [Coniochaeta sp. 2T2.1]|nr:P-loop containing nucleoside triphosphate hydrolase protein [Coniochaeta sp. 2T2.1]